MKIEVRKRRLFEKKNVLRLKFCFQCGRGERRIRKQDAALFWQMCHNGNERRLAYCHVKEEMQKRAQNKLQSGHITWTRPFCPLTRPKQCIFARTMLICAWFLR